MRKPGFRSGLRNYVKLFPKSARSRLILNFGGAVDPYPVAPEAPVTSLDETEDTEYKIPIEEDMWLIVNYMRTLEE